MGEKIKQCIYDCGVMDSDPCNVSYLTISHWYKEWRRKKKKASLNLMIRIAPTFQSKQPTVEIDQMVLNFI